MKEKKKILFLNTDLRGGGAEKILVNIVNNMDFSCYDVTVQTIFKEGVNRQFLRPEIKQKWNFEKPFKGYTRLALTLSPKFLFKKFITERYDVIVSFLEGFPSRIVAGCPDPEAKLVCWIHLELYPNTIGYEFRSAKEADKLYHRFDQIVCVAESVKDCFSKVTTIPEEKLQVIYNPLNVDEIQNLSSQKEGEKVNGIQLITVGRLNPQKGYDRLLRVVKKLTEEGFQFHLQILGMGPLQKEFEHFVEENNLQETVNLLGYQKNPYPYIKNADLFVCSSNKEGYSTVVTESILLETPVITTDCSGMNEILDNGNAGIIVENNEQSLYEGLKNLLSAPEKLNTLTEKTQIRSKFLKERNSYNDISILLDNLIKTD